MKIAVVTDAQSFKNLSLTENITPGLEFRLVEEVNATLISGGGKHFSHTDIFIFILGSGWNLCISLLAAHLYEKLKTMHETQLKINDEFVEIDEEEIKKALKKSNDTADDD